MTAVSEVGVQREVVTTGWCWLCGGLAVAAERLPGRRRQHRRRLLCAVHDKAVFGTTETSGAG